jgi:hypothetical protein
LGRFDCRVQEIEGVESKSTVSEMNEKAIMHSFNGENSRNESLINIDWMLRVIRDVAADTKDMLAYARQFDHLLKVLVELAQG